MKNNNDTAELDILISIIIPIYKKEDTLIACLNSVIKQTYSAIEIILINDGSPDGCLNICKTYAAKYDFIKLIDLQINQGVSTARNKGIEAAKGDYITFVDADDLISEDYIEALVTHIANADILMTPVFTDYDGKLLQFNRYQAIDYMYRKDGYEGGVVGKLFKAEIAKSQKFPSNMKLGEDAFFLFECILCSKSCAYYKKQIYYVGKSLYNSGCWMPFDKGYDTVRLLQHVITKTTDVFGKCPQSSYEALFERSLNIYMRYSYNEVSAEVRKNIKNNVWMYLKKFGIEGLPLRYLLAGVAFLIIPRTYAQIIHYVYSEKQK